MDSTVSLIISCKFFFVKVSCQNTKILWHHQENKTFAKNSTLNFKIINLSTSIILIKYFSLICWVRMAQNQFQIATSDVFTDICTYDTVLSIKNCDSIFIRVHKHYNQIAELFIAYLIFFWSIGSSLAWKCINNFFDAVIKLWTLVSSRWHVHDMFSKHPIVMYMMDSPTTRHPYKLKLKYTQILMDVAVYTCRWCICIIYQDFVDLWHPFWNFPTDGIVWSPALGLFHCHSSTKMNLSLISLKPSSYIFKHPGDMQLTDFHRMRYPSST